MISHSIISELLVKTGAYTDLEEPVILTSGELGIYYINTEKLCQDNGEFEKYGDDSRAMIQHAIKMMAEHSSFEEVINIVMDGVESFMKQDFEYVISGGQRRDWLFSGPVAYKLGLPHISLYKSGGLEIISKGRVYSPFELKKEERKIKAIHVSDLLTEGSSCYRIENKEEKGWVPSLRKEKIGIENLIAVVTRRQGGEEKLREQNVNIKSFVAIDEEFLRRYSKTPERALAYLKEPREWGENCLRENGALSLIETFSLEAGKLDRVKKFLQRYSAVLKEVGRLEELEKAVQEKYQYKISEMVN